MSAMIRQLPVVHRPSFHDPAWREQFDREVEALQEMSQKRPPRTRPLVAVSNCPRCRGRCRMTYDELTAEEKSRVGFGAMHPCPACQPLIVAYRQEGE